MKISDIKAIYVVLLSTHKVILDASLESNYYPQFLLAFAMTCLIRGMDINFFYATERKLVRKNASGIFIEVALPWEERGVGERS